MSSDYEYVEDDTGVMCFVRYDTSTYDVMSAVRVEPDLMFRQEDVDGCTGAIDDAFQDEWGVRPAEDENDAWFDIVSVPDDVCVPQVAPGCVQIDMGEGTTYARQACLAVAAELGMTDPEVTVLKDPEGTVLKG